MTKTAKSSITVGVVLGVLLVAAVLLLVRRLIVEGPFWGRAIVVDRLDVWSANGGMRTLKLASPLIQPTLYRARTDGAIIAISALRTEWQRLDPGEGKFIPLSAQPLPDQGPTSKAGERFSELIGTPDWFKVTFRQPSAIHFANGDVGPTLPWPAEHLDELAALDDDRLALTGKNDLFVARRSDKEFAKVTLEPPLPDPIVTLSSAGGAKLLVITSPPHPQGTPQILSTYIVDLDARTTSVGPSLPTIDQHRGVPFFGWQHAGDGTLFVVATQSEPVTCWLGSYDAPIQSSVLFLAFLGLAAIALRAGDLDRRKALAAFFATFVLLAGGGYAVLREGHVSGSRTAR